MTPIHHIVAAASLFLLGASFGSFLNVCIYRIPLGLSLFRPPSSCPGCGSRIAARDNLPVLGWLLLRGRCRCCRSPISPRYPIVEAAVGLLLVCSCFALGAGDPIELGAAAACWTLADGLAWSAFLVTGAMIAWDRGAVPRSVASSGLLAALVLAASRPAGPGGGLAPGLLDALLGALAAAGAAWASPQLSLRPAPSRRSPAAPGDVAFSATVGAFVGLRAIGPVLATASVLPLIVLAADALRRPRLSNATDPGGAPLPFSTALGLAGLAPILAGPWLLCQ
ncbi:prepilin peptidase [Tautonia sociabilis]|uniref:prepilin peptidase n=1 Tax=Tautonia sociabilis TaxID=2080755 RepID=UPI0018F632FD|nr:prepilin peptidase [Tautonia sociabilis]